MKCFFKRPPETQKSLGAALAAGLADFHQVHVVGFCCYFIQLTLKYSICTFVFFSRESLSYFV